MTPRRRGQGGTVLGALLCLGLALTTLSAPTAGALFSLGARPRLRGLWRSETGSSLARFPARASRELESISEPQPQHSAPRRALGESAAGTPREGQEPASCWSKRQQHLYRKELPRSSALKEALEAYELMHQRCTTNFTWEAYAQSLNASGEEAPTKHLRGCKYSVYTPLERGLGNKLLALVSIFAYSLLTNRTMLVHPDAFLNTLLCNPFEHSSWALDRQQWEALDAHFPPERRKSISDLPEGDIAAWAQGSDSWDLDLSSSWKEGAMAFFCKSNQQSVFETVPVLLMRTDVHLLPLLALVPEYERLFQAWFPDQQPFLHLARHLVHPANKIWHRVSRFHQVYLAHHTGLVGVQIRQFQVEDGVDERVLEALRTVLPRMTGEEEFLELEESEVSRRRAGTRRRRAGSVGVFVTALNQERVAAVKEFTARNIPEDGQPLAVHSYTHDGFQRIDEFQQENALVEIVLLSMCDKLLTTDCSTFGYVAAGLAGVPTYSMNIANHYWGDWHTNGKPLLAQVPSEPCCQKPPGYTLLMTCQEIPHTPLNQTLPHVRSCVDIDAGLQYYPRNF